MNGQMIFISHHSADSEAAEQARVIIERGGLRAWVAPRDVDLHPSGDFATAIPDGLAESAAMILLLGPRVTESKWVPLEITQAVNRGIPIVPVYLPGFRESDLPAGWVFQLNRSQSVKSGDMDSAIALCCHRAGISWHGGTALLPPTDAAQPPAGLVPNYDAATMFVDRDRRGLVDALQRAWDDVRSGGGPRAVALLGESGRGKTRLVQEFYRRLASEQAEPLFWPASIVSDGVPQAARESRKLITPPGPSPREGARMGYVWLGHEYLETLNGYAETGIPDLARQVGEVLTASRRCDPQGWAAKVVRAEEDRHGLQLSSAARLTHHLLDTDLADQGVEPNSVEAFWSRLARIWEISPHRPPIIIAVEDAHAISPASLTLLEQTLLERNLPILVICCAVSSRLGYGDDRGTFGRLLDRQLPNVTVIQIDRMPDDAIGDLARATLPGVDESIVRSFITKVDGNIYYAHTLLGAMAQAAEAGKLTRSWLDRRTGNFEAELLLQWQDLPAEVRRMLAAIAVLGSAVEERLCLHSLREAYHRKDLASDSDDLANSLESGWLRRLASDEVLRFLERPRWVVAHSDPSGEWEPADRHRILADALAVFERMGDHALAGHELRQRLHLELALAADAAGLPFQRTAAVRAGRLLSQRMLLAGDVTAMLRAAEEVESLVAGHAHEAGMAQLAVLSALDLVAAETEVRKSPTHAQVVAWADLAVTRADSAGPGADEERVRAYAALAHSHLVRYDEERMARAAQVLAQAEEYRNETPLLGPEAEIELLRSRAYVAFGFGDNAAAAKASEQRWLLSQRTFGAYDHRTRVALESAGFHYTRVDVGKSVKLREELLQAQLTVWEDPRHIQVLRAHTELAAGWVRTGIPPNVREAVTLTQSVLSAVELRLGPGNSDTVSPRAVHALALRRAGDLEEAVGNNDDARDLWQSALDHAQRNLDLMPADAVPAAQVKRSGNLAMAQVRLGHASGLDVLRSILMMRAQRWIDDGNTPLNLAALWTAAELIAGLYRLGLESEATPLLEKFPIERDPEWPAVQPRGWRSTRPQDARAGVL